MFEQTDCINFTPKNPPISVIALAGNKAELDIFRAVEFEEAQKYADKTDLIFMETSARTGANVDDIFLAIGVHFRSSISHSLSYTFTFSQRTSLIASTF